MRFVSRVVPDDQLDAATNALAGELAAKPALVLEATKRQVEEAAPSVPASDRGAEDDARAFATAQADPESLASAAAYVRRVRGKR
jgi:enoyl-CoA hydratase/carnithine racemase